MTRVYSSNTANCYNMNVRTSSTDTTVTYDSYIKDDAHHDRKYAIGVGWGFNFPSIDKSDTKDYLHMGDGAVYEIRIDSTVSNLVDYYLEDMKYLDETGTIDGLGYNSRLQTKEGLNYYFDAGGNLIVIKNRFGDTIRFTYTTFNETQVISSITLYSKLTSPEVYRRVTFQYTTTKVTVTANDKIIEYNLALGDSRETVPAQLFGLIPAHTSYKYKLVSVVYKNIGGVQPGDRTVTYEYNLDAARFDIYYTAPEGYTLTHYPANNYYLDIAKVIHPNGAETRYEYLNSTKRFDPDDPDNLSWMTEKRIAKRYDYNPGTAKDYNLIQFCYKQTDVEGKVYNQKTYTPTIWDITSRAESLVEKYYFNDDHLLIKKESSGNGFKQVELTEYSETKLPYKQQVVKYNTSGASETTTRAFTYDFYRNLICETVSGGSPTAVVSESWYNYDLSHFHVQKEATNVVDSDLRLKVGRSIDTFGRVMQETKSQVRKTGTTSASCAPPANPPIFYDRGASWHWIPNIRVKRFSFQVYYFAAAPWNYANYRIKIRKYDSATWIIDQLVEHQGGLFDSQTGTDNWVFDLTSHGNDYYEFMVEASCIGTFGSCIEVHSIQATGDADLVTTEESVTTSYQYNDTYNKSAPTQKTTGPYIANFEYDDTYHSYLKRAFVLNVGNSYFGTSGETVEFKYEYDWWGRKTKFTDGLAHQTTYQYDKWDRILEERHLDDQSTKQVKYYDFLNKVEVIDEDGVKSIYRYDGFGRHISSWGVLNNMEIKLEEKLYNSRGQLWQAKDPDGHITFTYYDASGRTVEVSYPDGTRRTISYDDKNRTKTEIDTNLHVTVTTSDPLGKTLTVVNNGQTLAQYQYDKTGRPVQFTGGNGQVIIYQQGLWGIKEEQYRLVGGINYSRLSDVKFEYDVLGNVTKRWWKSTPAGAYNCYKAMEYDQAGRLIKQSNSINSSIKIYDYDFANNVERINYHSEGSGLETYDVSSVFTYTPRNLLDTVTRSTGGLSFIIDYNYSLSERVEEILYPTTGTRVGYDYDYETDDAGLGRLLKVSNNGVYYVGSANNPGITYRQNGFMERITFANGMVQEFTPDSRNRIDQLKVYNQGSPGQYTLNLDYSMDGEGNITWINTDGYTYDSQNRLRTATKSGEYSTYQLDVMGNRTAETKPERSRTYVVSDHNLLDNDGENSYTYDVHGNRLTKTGPSGNWVYVYDEENRLVKTTKMGLK